jgi:hypothetical protein
MHLRKEPLAAAEIILARRSAIELDFGSGQKATSVCRRGMYVLPPGADVSLTGCFAPEAAFPRNQLLTRSAHRLRRLEIKLG